MVTEPDSEDPYLLVLAPGARPALTDTLPSAAAFVAWEFISGALLIAPRRVGAQLREPFAGQWRARRGEYRVRYDIDEALCVRIRVLDVAHRHDAYQGSPRLVSDVKCYRVLHGDVGGGPGATTERERTARPDRRDRGEHPDHQPRAAGGPPGPSGDPQSCLVRSTASNRRPASWSRRSARGHARDRASRDTFHR